jgi:3-oxoacyl-[acyl-carrier protein] reductase
MDSKNAIITGARTGIGLAVLRLFAQNHINCWAIVHRQDSEFEQEVKLLQEQNNVWIKIVNMDMEDSESIKSGFKEINSDKLPIDILINAAGSTSPNRSFTMTKMDDIRRIMNINFISILELTQLVLRNMMRHKSGSIVNIASIAAFCEGVSQLEYSCSKGALVIATKKLAMEVGKLGIRVNAVAPGLTDTKMLQSFEPSILKRLSDGIALKRLCKPEEIAEACLFLSSSKSAYITGEVLKIDGGGYSIESQDSL